MKLNRKLVLILALVTSLIMATTSTLAYLTDQDADVNVMTLGNVDILQNEQERTADGTLDAFTPNKPAYPAVGPIEWADEGVEIGGTEYKVFTPDLKNVIDKFVTVTNTGKSDAFIRTIVAIEAPDYDPDNLIHVNVAVNENSTHISQTSWAPVDLNGVKYVYSVFTYTNPLAVGATSEPSLMQLFLDSAATNEDVAKFGDTWEVIVLSQAVQTQGFADSATALDTAFGAANAKNVADWMGSIDKDDIGSPGDENNDNNPPSESKGDFDGVTFPAPATAVKVSSTDELNTALSNGTTDIVLAAGEYQWTGGSAKGKTLNLYGESKDAVLYSTLEGGEGADYDFDGSTVTFNGLTIDVSKHAGSFKGWARMNGTYNDCVIVGEYCLYGDAVFNYCTLNTSGNWYNIRTWGAPTATFTRCTFNSDGKAMLLYGTANTKLTIDSCVFNDTGVLPDLKAAIEIGDDYGKSYELIVNNTRVNGYEENDSGILTGSTLWANKNSMSSDKLNVVVDGVDIY